MSRACFTKHDRLLKASEYQFVFAEPIRSSDRYFTVLARRNTLSRSRLGTAFSKKRVKLAAARNRLKRISRESFRLINIGENLSTIDIVVLAGPNCVNASNELLFQSLAKHWQNLNKQCTKFSSS